MDTHWPAGENRSVIVAAAFSTDTTPPTSALTFNEGTNPGGQYEVSTGAHAWTYYYNPASTGTFTMTDAASDASGIAAVEFPDLTTTGFTGSGLRDTTSTYNSNTYTFGPRTRRRHPWRSAIVYDTFNNATAETVTFAKDTVNPTGGLISVPAFSSTLNNITITKTNYTDADSGIAAVNGDVITRSSPQAASNGICPGSGYTGSTVVTSPDTVPTDGQCYVYTLTGTDNVGNVASIATTNPILVDTTPPSAPTLAFSAFTSAYAAGTTVYFKGGAAGGFTVTPSSTDLQSGVASYSYPTSRRLGTNGASFTAAATTQTGRHRHTGADIVGTGTNPFTRPQLDSTPPAGGTISVPAFSASSLNNITITTTRNYGDGRLRPVEQRDHALNGRPSTPASAPPAATAAPPSSRAPTPSPPASATATR